MHTRLFPLLLLCALGIASNLCYSSDTIVSDAILPQAQLPTLKIRGKENPDVYLQSLDINVEVTGNIASTRYTMVFKNRTDRILEGRLTFPLPDERTVTHYALDINGRMRDAVPVDKSKAARVFEEIQQRRVDPGLLERVEGNNFRTRIYPIPSGGTRTVSIGYEEELTLEKGLLYYRLPMAYKDSIERFSVKATVFKGAQKPLLPKSNDEIHFDTEGENYVASFVRQNYRPSRALIFALPASADIPQVIMQPAKGSHYFFASVAPIITTQKKQWDNDLAIIWDVSLSGLQRNLEQEIEALNIIFSEKKDASVNLYFLNNKLNSNGEYKVTNGNWDLLKSALKTAVFDGGTDFSKINLNEINGNEILFFSDGISTLSDSDFLKNTKPNRQIHSIVSSSQSDYGSMKLISGKTNGKFININALSPEKLKNELLNETLQFLGTEHGKEVREVYPSIATPVHGSFSITGISDKNKSELILLFGFGNKVETRIKVQLDAKKAASQGNVHKIWAQKKINELDLSYEKNIDKLTELGNQFGIVTRNTSLIVLETIDDYINYSIAPPANEPQLLKEYQLSLKENEKKQSDTLRNILNDAVAAAEDIKKWWNTDFTPKPDSLDEDGYAEGGFGGIGDMLGGLSGGSGGSIGSRKRHPEEEEDISEEYIPQPTITIKPIKNDNEYFKKLTGKTLEDYQTYLRLRDDYINSPTFYFDMSSWFYTRGDKETALRILTSIADLELENASLYRLLGYRFKEYGEYELEKFVCPKVIQWRPMELQSYRDYALALANNGENQAALDSLYSMLTRSYSENIIERSRGIEEVVVMEINNLIAKNPSLKISKIDKRLILKTPIDIRVVINWNMDNTDIDLHVIDPNNEECYYEHSETKIGGRISADIIDGYGPEQFLLKKAVKGKYKVYVNYFGDNQFTSDGPSTIMAEIFTKYSDKTEQRQVVSLQMSNAKDKDDKVEVAEFSF